MIHNLSDHKPEPQRLEDALRLAGVQVQRYERTHAELERWAKEWAEELNEAAHVR